MTLGVIPEAQRPREEQMEMEEKFPSGRVVLVAVDHGPSSRTAFSWALKQFICHVDTVHLLHVLPTAGRREGSPLYEATQSLFEQLGKEAYEAVKVHVIPVLREGDAGKEICAEASRCKAVAVVMGSRGLGPVKSLIIGSATEYCARHSQVPLIIVPHNYHAEYDQEIGEEQ